MRFFLATLCLLLTSTAFAGAADIHLSVAASMTDATRELMAVYRQQVPDTTFLPNFAGSGALAKQIAQGAPADLFISANPKWMDYLVTQGLVAADQVRPFANNSLVFAGRKGPVITSLADLTRLQRIAIGSPKSVPAGQYAEQALQAAGLLAQVQGKLVLAQDVRQALVYAERGEVEGAFVYKTDALLAREAVVLFDVPQALYPEVVYPMALTLAGSDKPEAVAFSAFLQSAAATGILRRYGFIIK